MLTQRQREVLDLRDGSGLTFSQIADRLGISKGSAATHYKRGKERIDGKRARVDPGALKVLDKFGLGDLSGMSSGWVHREDPETGEFVSVHLSLGKDGSAREVDLEDLMSEAIGKVFTGQIARRCRPKPQGGNLLVVDLADLHIGKLCVRSETGAHYDREEAVRRGIEGTRALLEKAQKHGVAHILFVLGNDVIHIDTPRRTTTSGTPQDTDGTLAVMWDDAFAFYVACIDLCRKVAPVSLLYCPSNHDWFAGYSLARAVRAWYRNCPEVSASDYNTSHRHRKYFRFGGALLGFAHGDGAREKDLGDLMVTECRGHLDETRFRFWYLHHLHHKIRKTGGGTHQRQREKDLIGMTVLRNAAGLPESDAPALEYVRSPSPAEGGHARTGYVNLQAGEVCLHDPSGRQSGRFTEVF